MKTKTRLLAALGAAPVAQIAKKTYTGLSKSSILILRDTAS